MSSAILKSLAATVFVIVMAGPAVGAPKPSPRNVAACALGAEVMAEQARGGVNAFDTQESFANTFIKDGISKARPYGWGLSAWQRALLTKQPPVNLFVACPDLASRLPAGTRLATDADRAAVQRLGQMPPRTYIGRIAAPSIAADGRTALVMEFTKCSGLCGGGSLYVYKRVGERWVKAEPVFQMIS